MKLPVSFGTRLLYRLLIPGFLLALLLLPACQKIALEFGIGFDLTSYLTLATILLGWLLSLWDMRIYMLFKGLSWPIFLFNLGLKRQQKKLEQWRTKYREHKPSPKSKEYSRLAFRYPISDGRYPAVSREPTAMMPTELGNVIYGFETYPTTKYGADGVFYWHRVWHGLDKDMRQEIDEIQSVADGALYACMVFLIGSILFLIYAVLEATGLVDLLTGTVWCAELALMVTCLILSWVFYRRAIACNESFGERVKAMFDHEIDKLPIAAALAMIREKTGDSFCGMSFPEKNQAAWRYLRWHQYRPPNTTSNVDIESYRTQPEQKEKPDEPSPPGEGEVIPTS